ncbi:MAG: hypothetical protein OQK55_10200, partial [Thermoanaerobaculales bacterium]|nr:hypothetical protein [Thermoanaerobaculales bacterium]
SGPRLRWMDPQQTVDPATGTVKVTVAVEGGSGLRPGAFVRVDIVTDTHTDALVVARSALVAEGRRWHLYRLTDDDTAVEQIEVELGFETGDRIEIAGTTDASVEITPGQSVIIVGAPALSDGAKVRVMTDEDAESEPEPAEQEG